ncbi:protein Z, vitamin K-dependent plasma glycoprotein b [Takifugu rubripes]|uniref:Protein Z, vitamin K-dependent plasma glycoprotein b n=1 Tax=Takifugu rubripes TaxID=31033 RepID=H2SK01_TAKRU|nr:vitamin K-dependent protein Z [Takifugu rubripes]
MAVSIMSAPARVCVLHLCLLGGLLQVLVQGEVFWGPQTSNVFLRSKRANMYLIEEILQGNLERECYEELCTYEEAREYFENTKNTEVFWAGYHDGNQCEPNPCLHGGNCTDKRGAFNCSCVAPYYGKTCELGARRQKTELQSSRSEYSQCPTDGPTACQQFCTTLYHTFRCFCMPGFKLQSDKRSCHPEVEFPCGQLPKTSNRSTLLCLHGNCPWQVKVVNSRGVELCGGVLMAQSAVLTGASCLHQLNDVPPQDLYVVPGNQKRYLPVQTVHLHPRFRRGHPDNDLAFLILVHPLKFSHALIHLCLPPKDFCEKILMHSGTKGFTKRHGGGQTQELAYMTLDQCRNQMNVSHRLSNKMFCMRRTDATRRPSYPSKDGFSRPEAGNNSRVQNSATNSRQCGRLLPGTPVATVDHGTVYLTGLLKSAYSDCDDGKVFTKISRYQSWINMLMEELDNDMIPQNIQFPSPY